ncbi:MAG: YqgE/AlgH family protein [Bacteroidota bacterium]
MDFLPKQDVIPKRGQVLLSEPYISDTFFHRTVVFLCENNAEGSFGFVLNNYIDLPIHKVIVNLPELSGRISLGGPVKNDSVFYLHTLGELVKGSTRVMPGIWYGGEFEDIKVLIDNNTLPENSLRFFIGYSGWGAKQLQEEIASKSWFVANIEVEDIMNSSENNLWQEVLKTMGVKGDVISKFPDNPNLN